MVCKLIPSPPPNHNLKRGTLGEQQGSAPKSYCTNGGLRYPPPVGANGASCLVRVFAMVDWDECIRRSGKERIKVK